MALSISAHGFSWEYFKFGNGPEILFAFHGFDNDANDFRIFEKAFGERYTIVAVNLFFHGKSDTPTHHAEDEFTRAILGTSKFDEECLFNTTFEGQIRCYANDEKEVGNMIAFIKDLCDNRMISIGAGSCYPKITIKEKEN